MGEWLTPGKEPRYPWNRRLDGTRFDLDVSEKRIISYPDQYTNPRPSRPHPLYRIRSSDSCKPYIGKCKSKVHPIKGHEGPEEEYKYSSTLSLTLALDGVSGQRYAPAALPPGKTRYALYRRLAGHQGRSGRVRKISLLPGFDSRTVQPVADRYTD
jgi:hypothetical protein